MYPILSIEGWLYGSHELLSLSICALKHPYLTFCDKMKSAWRTICPLWSIPPHLVTSTGHIYHPVMFCFPLHEVLISQIQGSGPLGPRWKSHTLWWIALMSLDYLAVANIVQGTDERACLASSWMKLFHILAVLCMGHPTYAGDEWLHLSFGTLDESCDYYPEFNVVSLTGTFLVFCCK